MALPECIANIRHYLEDHPDKSVLQTTLPWTAPSIELAEELERTVACASSCEPNLLSTVVDDLESVADTLDDLAQKLYCPHITQSRALLLAHSEHYSEAEHILTNLYELLDKDLRQANASWRPIILADIAITQAAKGRVLDWRGQSSKSLVRYKAALNAVRQSDRFDFHAFVHGLYHETLVQIGMLKAAWHVLSVKRDLDLKLLGRSGRSPAILDQRLWSKGLGSELASSPRTAL